jgi:hypothetical protein
MEFKRLKEEEKQVTATWDASTFVTYPVNIQTDRGVVG